MKKVSALYIVLIFFGFAAELEAAMQCHQLIELARLKMEAIKAVGSDSLQDEAELERIQERLVKISEEMEQAHNIEISAAHEEIATLRAFESSIKAKIGEELFRQVLRDLKTPKGQSPTENGASSSVISRALFKEGLIDVAHAKSMRNLLIENYGYSDPDLPIIDTLEFFRKRIKSQQTEEALSSEKKNLENEKRKILERTPQLAKKAIKNQLRELEAEFGSEFVFRTAVNLGYVAEKYSVKGPPALAVENGLPPSVVIHNPEQFAHLDWAVRSGWLIRTPLTTSELKTLSRSHSAERAQNLSEEDRSEIRIRELAQAGELTELKAALSEKSYLAFIRDDLGLSALDYAVANGKEGVVEYLLSESVLQAAGVDKAALFAHRTSSGRSLLSFAILNDFPTLSKSLIAQGAVLDKADAHLLINELGIFYHPLGEDGKFDHSKRQPTLLFRTHFKNDLNPFVASALKDAFQTALDEAVKSGAISKAQLNDWLFEVPIYDETRIWMVSSLIRAGADPNAKNSQARTLLFEAAEHGLDDLVRILLEADANPGLRDNRRRTPHQVVKGRLSRSVENPKFRARLERIEEMLRPPTLGQRLSNLFKGR